MSSEQYTPIKPSDQILFVGHVCCYATDSVNNKQIYCWKLKRIAVTQDKMYFFNHPEEDINAATNPNKGLLQKNYIDATSIAGKSWGQRDIQGHICRIIYMETLLNQLSLEKYYNSSPRLTGRAVIIANKNTLQCNYFTTENFVDAFKLVRAITMANAWLSYKSECDAKKIQPNQRILKWLPYCVNQEISILDVSELDLSYQDDNEFLCFIQFVKKTTTITGLKINASLDQDIFRNHAMHLLTNIRYDQLLTLNLEGTQISDQILQDFHSVICYNGYLTTLCLSKNLLTDASLENIIKIFEVTPDLKIFDVSDNRIVFKEENQACKFFNRVNELMESFTLKMAHNPIVDSVIIPLEKHVLFAKKIDIICIDISYSSISKHGLWRLFMGYINNYKRLEKFSLNIFPLPFHPQIMQNAREVFALMNKLYIQKPESEKEEDRLKQKKEENNDKDKLLNSTNKSGVIPNDPKEAIKPQLSQDPSKSPLIKPAISQIQLSPIAVQSQPSNTKSPLLQPINLSEIQQAVNIDDEYDEQKLRTICFQRISYTNGQKPPPNKKKYILKVHELEQDIDFIIEKQSTVEEIKQLCSNISSQEFEFPLRLLEGLHEYIWNRLNEAILIRDHYSISFLTESATLVGLDISFFIEKISTVQQRKAVLMTRIENILNFDTVRETDVNGELDEVVKECLRLDVRGLPVDMLLMIKEKRDNYVKSYIEQDFDPEKETIDTVQQDCFSYLNSGKDKVKVPKEVFNINSVINSNLFSHTTRCDYLSLSKIQHQTLLEYIRILEEQLRKSQNNQYYYLLAKDRSLFLSTDHLNNFQYQIWNRCGDDLQLNCSRLIIQYNHFLEREVQQLFKQPMAGPQQIQLIQQYYQNPNDPLSFQEEFVLEKYGKLKGKIKDNPLLLNHIEGQTFVNPIIFETQPGINNYFKEISPLLQKILQEPSGLDKIDNFQQLETNSQELVEKLLNINKTINNSAIVQSLYDEIYLQIYKYLNRKQQQSQVVSSQSQIVTAFKLLSLLSVYTPPSNDIIQYIKAWIYQHVTNPRIDMFAKKIITNLLNHQDLQFVGPNWIPSLFEISWRYTALPQFQITVKTTNDNDIIQLRLNEYDQIKDIVNMLMENEFLRQKGLKDLGLFWLYVPGMSSAQIGNSQNYPTLDLALLYEQSILEVISIYWKNTKCNLQQQSAPLNTSIKKPQLSSNNNFYFLFKRRLYCAHYIVNIEKLSSEQLESLYDDCIRTYLETDYYLNAMQPDAIMKLAALIYNVQMKTKNPQAAILNPDNVLKDFKPQRMLYPSQFKMDSATTNDSEKLLEITKRFSLLYLNLDQLRYNIIVVFRHQPFYCTSMFQATMKDNKLSSNSKIHIGVNTFGILLFQSGQYKQPFRLIMYEELVYIFVNQNEGFLSYYEKDSIQINTLNVTFEEPQRSNEWHLDILSYCVLRLMDQQYALYSYNELWKMMYRFNALKLCKSYKIQTDIKQGVINIVQYNANEQDIENEFVQQNLNQEIIYKKNILMKEVRNASLINSSGKEFPYYNSYKLYGKQRIVSKQLQYYFDKSSLQSGVGKGTSTFKDNLIQRGSFGITTQNMQQQQQLKQDQLDNINRQLLGINSKNINVNQDIQGMPQMQSQTNPSADQYIQSNNQVQQLSLQQNNGVNNPPLLINTNQINQQQNLLQQPSIQQQQINQKQLNGDGQYNQNRPQMSDQDIQINKISKDLGQELNIQVQQIPNIQQQNFPQQSSSQPLIQQLPQNKVITQTTSDKPQIKQQQLDDKSQQKFAPPSTKLKQLINSSSIQNLIKNPEEKKDIQPGQESNEDRQSQQDNNSRSSSKGRAKKESKIDGMRPRRSSQSPKPSEDGGDAQSQAGLSDLIQDKPPPINPTPTSQLRSSGVPNFKRKTARDSKYNKQ